MKCRKNRALFFFAALFLLQTASHAQPANKDDLLTLKRMAESFERVGQYENAADFYIRACLANPQDVVAYLGAKRALAQLRDYDRLEQLIHMLEQKRRDIRYRVDLAWIIHARGDEATAREAWKRILQENPYDQQAYALIGQIYAEAQLYEEAIGVFQSARAMLKDETVYMFEMANLYKITNEQEKLVHEYLRYAQTHPQQIAFLSTELQRFCQNQPDVRVLLKELNKALKNQGEIEWAIHLFLADAYSALDIYDNALLHYRELESALLQGKADKIFAPSQSGKYLFDFANMALNAGATQYAEEALLAIIADLPDSKFVAKSRLNLANVYVKNRNYAQALAALQLFVESNESAEDTRNALLQIGEISFQHLFDISQAESAYKRALHYPDNRLQIQTWFRLAECALARDDLTGAENYLQNAFSRTLKAPDLKDACLLQLAYLEFYRMRPRASLNYLADLSAAVPTTRVDELENDALELSILLQDNIHDSTGLAVLGKSRLLMNQRRYEAAKTALEVHLSESRNSLLRSELRLLLAEAYRKMKDFAPAVSALDSIYADQDSYCRDEALLTSAEIYEQDIADYALAQQRYEKLLAEFPGSIHLERARERVRKLEEKK
ncbi:tetratricopeptide repeat protein [candidate division KSB1 bacterium]|nr:tetratricopeptide repeat protein [candidate division KSB1 bacterium]